MPLPYNTALSLLGYSRPGDAVQSKPRQAMIIRMSTETLDALESFPNHPQMEFELGANPRIYIGETSFSMRHAKETTLHELYLRASSITKKTAPLKLYANVVGKFTVERELHDNVCDKLRASTQDAVNQRMTRTTQFIEKPPEMQPNSKKRKEPPPPSTMFRKPIRQSDKLMSTLGNAPNRTSTLVPWDEKPTASSSYPLPSNDEGPRVRHGSMKIRRRSPIYTSSEDEDTASRSLLSRSVTTDHATLRARYSTAYLEYLTSLQKLVMQRRMVDQMLKNGDSGSVGSVTDSDGEVELLHPEELARLAADHRKRHEELVLMQQMFEKTSTTDSQI